MPNSLSRFDQLQSWLLTELSRDAVHIEPASTDASFRCYYRIQFEHGTFIVMDAPPPQEDVRPFVRVAKLMQTAGLQTPEIHAVDEERGFLLLGDLGNRSYFESLTSETVEGLYADALKALLALQQGVSLETAGLPPYDEALLTRELGIFREWLLECMLGMKLSHEALGMLDNVCRILIDSALEQPKVCVHRDYHSRNLMVTDHKNPGVLDFQDAVAGPITYDLASLLRDCYIAWPEDRVYQWVEDFRVTLQGANFKENLPDAGQFRRWFDLMGMQRHLKAAGIFARLKLRDDKPGYIKDIPRTLGYVVAAGRSYPELAAFADFIEQSVLPRVGGELTT